MPYSDHRQTIVDIERESLKRESRAELIPSITCALGVLVVLVVLFSL